VFGINIGLHRLLSHRSFEAPKWFERATSLIAITTTVGSPLAWVALHRQHHKSAETSLDPHSPYILGWWRAWFGFWNTNHIDLKLIKDLRKDKFQKALHKYYLLLLFVYIAILALIDPWLIVFAYALPASMCLHATSSIIVISHIHGYKTYKVNDESRNSWIASLITLGEGWHNNHHAHPRDWNNQHKWWEFDVTAWIIRLVKK
jgi:stearoyl-CoA desaturase (delta-9 desaturase)